MEQKSNEWFEERFGKFTASEFYKLMSGGKRKMTPEELIIEKLNKGKRTTVDILFGDVGMGYINKKIDEIISSHDMDNGDFAGNKATEWGEYWEPVAREAFEEKTGMKVDQVGFILIDEFFGGSPDGVIKDEAIIEIKCPYSTANHTENLFLIDEVDFREKHEDYYIQMQVNMIAANVEKGFFVSYDPRKLQKSLKLKIIEVQKNKELCNEILFRYKEAIKIVSEKQKILYNIIN